MYQLQLSTYVVSPGVPLKLESEKADKVRPVLCQRKSRPPAVLIQRRHTADPHSTCVSSKRAMSDTADRSRMLHLQRRVASGGFTGRYKPDL